MPKVFGKVGVCVQVKWLQIPKKTLIYIKHILVLENTNLFSGVTSLIIIKRYTHLRDIPQVFFFKKGRGEDGSDEKLKGIQMLKGS